MRSSKSRSRGNKNRSNRPTGGNIVNRVFDSSGPDGKVRGTPQQIIEKYTQLHRDAQLSGDRVAAENFAQHAEHYLRMLAEAQKEIDKVREDQERENRERQADRDRERTQRLKAQEDASSDPGAMEQPDFRGGDDDDADSGLVETPEAKSGQPTQTAQSGQDGQSDQGQPSQAKASEGEGQPAPRSRRSRSRKPKTQDGGDADGGRAASEVAE